MSVISAIRVPATSAPAKAAIIFVHGLGDSGQGWSFLPQFINRSGLIPHEISSSINYVFPNAPSIPITVNGGVSMPGWFDLYEFGNPNARQDVVGFFKSVSDVIKALIDEQVNKFNIPAENIIIGGFSQGAALSLATLATLNFKIGGVVALSGFVTPPVAQELEAKYLVKDVNYNTPVFQGHGTEDPLIAFAFAEKTAEYYKDKLGFKNLQFHAYKGIAHSASEEELADVINFIKGILTK
ncbi:uncharacterized protein LODBEIA_P54470 [Lodderomyces beijingensis]|uniref:Acyl-protein thioesterase 1 n=1 Tax=Lodderomyces beijingensis TaxID=1775926 RepID=A0ABP0ZU87_9ASCO